MKEEMALGILKNIVLEKVAGLAMSVFLFGSRAKGSSRLCSDIDVGFVGNEPLPALVRMEIEEAIEESPIPYKVDLVDFGMLSESFKKQALATAIRWM